MTGKVVTFYSYKGGVGRSFALANIATILAQWGHRVLMVDWDIEAPGLRHYFPRQAAPARGGVIDFLEDCRRSEPGGWEDYAIQLVIKNGPDELFLMPAEATGDRDYADVVQDISWDDLYDRHGLGARLEELRSQWIREFDFVLIDSRTGVTDFSGLTTAQLPDVLAFMFTANEQSLRGCVDIARRAMEARKKMPVDRPAILPLPIPARFEPREEFEQAKKWRKKFNLALSSFFEFWAPPGTDTLKLIDLLTIPYVPRWTFGEDLAVLLEPAGTDGVRSPGHAASYACETIAALFVQDFGNVELLTSSRDEFVHSARSRASERRSIPAEPLRLFVSRSASSHAERITAALYRMFAEAYGRDFRPLEDTGAEIGSNYSTKLQEIFEAADAFVFIVDEHLSSSHLQREIDWIQRVALRSDTPKPIIPIVIQQVSSAFFKSKLANYFAIFIDPEIEVEEQLRPLLERVALQLDRPLKTPTEANRERKAASKPGGSERSEGVSIRNGWTLQANVRKHPHRADWFMLDLDVGPLRSSGKVLHGAVIFDLDFAMPSPPHRRLPVEGRAKLTMLLTEAPFLVRALVEQDQTRLELDLTNLPDLPARFRTSSRRATSTRNS